MINVMEEEKFLTVTEVAKLFGVSWQTISSWTKKGKLKAYRLTPTGIRRYKASDINKLLKPIK